MAQHIWLVRRGQSQSQTGAFVGLDVHLQGLGATMVNAAISLLEIDDDKNHFVRCWNERAHVMDLSK
jgi:hypothetical protein